MGTITRFEDIEAWSDARLLVTAIYKQSRDGELGKDFGMRDQLQRAAVSIMANIAEGFERKNEKEFAHYLRIARGSCAEVQSHLYVAFDVNLIDKSAFDELQAMAAKTGRKITAFQRYLKQASST